MSESKKIIIAASICALIVGSLGAVLIGQSRLLAKKKLPPIVMSNDDIAQSESGGAVLGETSTEAYSNPLKNLYVNPFQD